MIFYIQTGVEQDWPSSVGAKGLQVIKITTDSLVPRTNRKHIRKVLSDVVGISPPYIKQVMKDLEFFKPEDLGITNLKERYELYAKAMKDGQKTKS